MIAPTARPLSDPADGREIDKWQVQQRFGRAAASYDAAATVQRRMADTLFEELGDVSGRRVLDLGCGTGYLLSRLAPATPRTLVGLDLSPPMLDRARRRCPSAELIAADLEAPPFPDRAFDVVASNAALQWCDLNVAAAAMRALLAPGGRLAVGTLGPATLKELRQPAGQPAVGVLSGGFPNTQCVADAFRRAGFRRVWAHDEVVSRNYASVDEMLMSVKRLGATDASPARRRGLMGKRHYRDILRRLEHRLRRDGCLQLSYQPIYLTAER